MTGKRLTPLEIPAWLLNANEKAGIGTRDVTALFGYSEGALAVAVDRGSFPAPDFRLKAMDVSQKGKKRVYWRKDTLIAEMRRRHELKLSIDARKAGETK